MFLASIESLMIGMLPMPSVVTLRASRETPELRGAILPIWIGTMEATAIAAALEDSKSDRPLTHDLTNKMVHALGGTVSRVVIDRVEGPTFYATVYLRCENGMFTRVDARPSDAIALAVHANAPLFVEEEVMQAAGCPRAFREGGDEQIEMDEFHKFIEQVEPEDFAKHVK